MNHSAIAQAPDVFVVGDREGGVSRKMWLKRFAADGTEDTHSWNLTVNPSGMSVATGVAIAGSNDAYVYGVYGQLANNQNGWSLEKYSACGDPDPNWSQLIFGGTTHGIALDSLGNAYLAGVKHSSNDNDWWLKKVGPNGVEITSGWDKVLDGGHYHDNPYAIAVDAMDDIWVAGMAFTSATTFGWWIHKYSPSGSLLWTRLYPNVAGRARSIAFDSAGNAYIVGSRDDFTASDKWWLKKFDPSGVEDVGNWNLQFQGGSRAEAYGVALDSQENVYVVGHRHNGTDDDWWLKKFDANGNEDLVNWNLTFDGGQGDDEARDIAIDANDNIYVVGWRDNGVDDDWWLKKFDVDGNEDTANWNKVFASGNGNDQALAVEIGTRSDRASQTVFNSPLFPNPSAMQLSVTPPVVGEDYAPRIDHTTFVPAAIFDLFNFSTTAIPAGVPTPNLGTILCDIGVLFAHTPAGSPWPIVIPSDCSLIGQSFCIQGASFQLVGGFSTCDAIDFTIGAF